MSKCASNLILALSSIGAIVLSSCGRVLDVAPVEEAIKAELSGKGGLSIQSITCPKNIRPEPEQKFECIGALKPDGGFFVTVKQESKEGQVSWEVPSVWRLLNLSKLEIEVQQALRRQRRIDLNVNCGGIYRVTQPGDSFECDLTQQKPKSVPIPATVVVKVEPQGKVTWQEVREIAVKNPSVTSIVPKAAINPVASPNSSASIPDSTVVKDASGWVQLDD